jgi:hypothetical protein
MGLREGIWRLLLGENRFMKYIMLNAVFLALAAACSTPPDRSAIALQEHYLINQIFRNQARSAKIIQDAGRTSRPYEIAAVENIKRISSLRDSYTAEPIATNLLALRTQFKNYINHPTSLLLRL